MGTVCCQVSPYRDLAHVSLMGVSYPGVVMIRLKEYALCAHRHPVLELSAVTLQ